MTTTQHVCRVCQRVYEFDATTGYHRGLCSSFCDGVEHGRQVSGAAALLDALEAAVFMLRVMGVNMDAHSETRSMMAAIAKARGEEVTA